MKISLSSVALIISLNRGARRRRRGARMVFTAPATPRIRCTRINRPANPRRVHRDAALPPLFVRLLSFSRVKGRIFFYPTLSLRRSPLLRSAEKNGLSSQRMYPAIMHSKALDISLAYSSGVSIKKSPSVKIIYRVSRWLFPAGCEFFYEPRECRRQKIE